MALSKIFENSTSQVASDKHVNEQSRISVKDSFNTENSHNKSINVNVAINAFNRSSQYIEGSGRVKRAFSAVEIIIMGACVLILYAIIRTTPQINLDGFMSLYNMAR